MKADNMTRMDRRKEMENRRKRAKVKWLLFFTFLVSTLLFYFFGTHLFSRLMAPGETIETYSLVYNQRPEHLSMIQRQGVLFVPMEWVQAEIMPGAEVLEQQEKVRWVPEHAHLRFSNAKVADRVGGSDFPLEINLLRVEDDLFFPLLEVMPLLGFNGQWYEDTKLLVVDQVGTSWFQGELLDNAQLRAGRGRKDPELTALALGESVRVLETHDTHHLVLTQEGYLGFLPQHLIGQVKRTSVVKAQHMLRQAPESTLEKPFGMVWDYVAGTHPDRSEEDKIDGLQVFSPTWFELKNDEGDVANKGQFRYVSTMKSQGYHLWGLVTNAFDPDLTERFLHNPESRKRFISQLLVYGGLYQLDGINIDFENMHYRNQDLFTGFVKELSEALKENQLTVSIDVTIPGGSLNWSQVYDRKSIEPYVDYFAVMTYDEHWGSSPVAGSVASIGWVERGIVATLEEVPSHKVILGVPLYTRLWEEKPGSGGGVSVSSRAMGMQFIRRTLEENGITEDQWEWLEDIGQYYAEYEADGNRYRVWLEDERSLAIKAALIDTYELAGFAAWRKDFETPDVWEALQRDRR